jgi:hypothetical protein
MPRIVAVPEMEKADRSLCHFAVVGLDAASNRVSIQQLRLGGNPRVTALYGIHCVAKNKAIIAAIRLLPGPIHSQLAGV